MDKTASAFWDGFEKQALSATTEKALVAGVFGMYGALFGGSLGAVVGNHKGAKSGVKFLDELRTSKEKVDAKDAFAKMKKLLPENTILLTRNDLHRLIDKEKSYGKRTILQSLRDITENGNAGAIHQSKIKGTSKKYLPDVLTKNHVILSDNKIVPSILLHEAGHIIDYEKETNKDFLPKMWSKMRSTYKQEIAAWDEAPGEVNKKMRENALSSYSPTYHGVRGGALAGATLGLVTGLKMMKKN